MKCHRLGVRRRRTNVQPGLCLESKPTCTRNGGKVIQVKPRDEDSKDLTMRCCGVQKCKMPHTEKKENIVVKLLVSKHQSFIIVSVHHK